MPKGQYQYIVNSLFNVSTSDFHLNACVGNNGGPYDFKDYTRGYFFAAEKVALELKNDPIFRSRVDIIIYPLCYLYRHALELGIKGLIIETSKIVADGSAPKFNHNLKANWKTLLDLTNDLFKSVTIIDGLEEVMDTITKIVDDISEFDESSQTFRYPTDRGGERHLVDASIINVEILFQSLNPVGEMINWWFYALEEIGEYRYE